MDNTKYSFNYWKQRVGMTMTALREADPNGWADWFDRIPDGNLRDIHLAVKARVIELTGTFPTATTSLHRGVFIWNIEGGAVVYSKEIGKPELYMLDFDSEQAAKDFIDGMSQRDLGYGVVLDVLPVLMGA